MTLASRQVAIVGIGCRFPGGVADPAGFWRAVLGGVDAVGEIPANRIDLGRYFDERPATPGRTMTRFGAFLERIEDFDAAFFGISPREAERIDPQQRLLLETGWEALEDAGWNVTGLAGRRGGVFVGQWISDFEGRLFAEPESVDFYMTTGSGRYAASGRLSYVLGLLGPSLTVDSACSSSLAAVHLAVQSIRSGESEFALAGGVNIILQPHISIAYSQSRMMAPDGRCKFGDARGDGYVRSEGAGLVVLKPLDRALADGDRVYAVIRGSAVNNDGRTSGSMGTPSRVGQEDLLRSAYRDAGCPPGTVGYIEAHGTGTRAGDPVELGALGAVMAEGREPGRNAWVGSVKTNFGHTEGAAGVAGLIKAALAVHHGVIPPSLHCSEPSPAIPWSELPLRVVQTAVEWAGQPGPRRAGVSAFGIAGTNAHVVLEEPPRADSGARPAGRGQVLLAMSARDPRALRQLASAHADRLEHADTDTASVCWNAAVRRTPLEHRAAMLAPEKTALVEALRSFASGGPATAEGVVREGLRPQVAFVFPGQGGQWAGMGRELLAKEPAFREALERCDAAARPYLDVSIVEQLTAEPGAPEYRMDRIDVIQPVLVALSIGYAALLRSLGVEPSAVVGHSMGEVGAAFVAGVLDLDQAMRIICRRSALMAQTSGRGAMAMVDLPMAEAALCVAEDPDRVAVAASNSQRSSVISGDPDAVTAMIAALESRGVFCRLVKVDVASHSPQMETPAAALAAELGEMVGGAAAVPIYSTVLGRRVAGDAFGADYWGRNLRQPVRFHEAVQALVEAGTTCFVELGPHPVLAPAIEQTVMAMESRAAVVACGRRDETDGATGALAASLWTAGADIRWQAVLSPTAVVDLPAYPWQRERHWVREAAIVSGSGSRTGSRAAVLSSEQREWLHVLRWTPIAAVAGSTSATGHRVLLVGPSDDALRVAAEAAGATVNRVRDVSAAADMIRDLTGPATVVLLGGDEGDQGFGALTLLRHLLEAGPPAAVKLVIATTGAQGVDGYARRVAVEQAVLWGVGRVISEEHPELWGGLIDLDPEAPVEARAAQLTAGLWAGDGEDQTAWRDGQRLGLRLDPLEPSGEEVADPWLVSGAWLITGGLGDVPLELAGAMVRHGVHRLVLMGRNGLPQRETWREVEPVSREGRRIAAVRALEAAGASVQILVADVADPVAVERALARYEAEAWPPIAGVLHAAGVLEPRLASQTDRSSYDRVLGPKLGGALLLDRLLPTVERFVLISSMSTTLGISGMASYAGANAGLDALAHARRVRGLHGQSVQSGAWLETGMHGGANAADTMGQLQAMGIEGHSAAAGTALFTSLVARPEAVITVMPVDWGTYRRARRGRAGRLFANRLDAGGDQAQETLADRLGSAPAAERRRLLDPVVREAVGRVLRLQPARLDPRKPLGSVGLSSLLAMELRNRLESLLGRPLSATLAWNYPTIDALVGYLAGESTPPSAGVPAGSASNAPPGVAAVADMSDAEAARLLRRRR